MKSVTSKYGLKSHVIFDLLRSYKKRAVEKGKLINKIKRRAKTISSEYVRIIKNFMENQKNRRPTVSQIKSHLMKSESVNSIS